MWHLEMWFSGGLDSAGLMGGFDDLEGLFQGTNSMIPCSGEDLISDNVPFSRSLSSFLFCTPLTNPD